MHNKGCFRSKNSCVVDVLQAFNLTIATSRLGSDINKDSAALQYYGV